MKKTVILASQSPRRQEILKSIGINFKILNPNISEKTGFKKPSFIVRDIANKKALKIKNFINEKSIIIAADTIVFCKKEIIGKPKSYKDARRILNKITKFSQFVYTGVVILDLYENKIYKDYEKTKVIMNKIPEDLVDKIISENMDKAGCYAIQSGDKLVKKIVGDYYNVVGLPLGKVLGMLKKCGLKIDENRYKNMIKEGKL